MPPGAPRYTPTPKTQLSFAAEYLHFCRLHGGHTPETLRSHLVDTVVVPSLDPESCRAMLPFGEGVETRGDAWGRLRAIAVTLGVVCGGRDEVRKFKEVEGEVFGVLREAGEIERWLGGEEPGTVGEGDALVRELFDRAGSLREAWKKGEAPPELAGEAAGAGEAGAVIKAGRKVLKKAEGRRMKLKALAEAVAEKVGGGWTRKKVKRVLREEMPQQVKRVRLEGKYVILDDR
jgi:hypothetical protein